MSSELPAAPTSAVPPSAAQAARQARFSAAESVDIHCHCLPGLDDGPATLADAVAICRALVDDGVTTVIATPHQLGPHAGRNPPAEVRAAVSTMRRTLAAEGVPLRVLPGGDVRVDDRLGELVGSGQVCTLGDGGAFLLLELPHESVVELAPLLADLTARGVTTILSHPERNEAIARRPDVLLPWLGGGMLLQVTAGSLVGQFGPVAERVGWQLVQAGQVSIIATDAHDARRRPPQMSVAIDALVKRVGHAVARRLCVENPLKVLNGDRAGWALRRPAPPAREPQRRRGLLGWFS